jgi:TetR/AcrR family transcriptional regulator, transcriptional repressor for nem operon
MLSVNFWIVKSKSAKIILMTQVLSKAKPNGLTGKGQKTRDHIVLSAAELFYAKGTINTSIDDVKSDAKVSSSQLYHYFENKHDLVRAVIAYQTENMLGNKSLADLHDIASLRVWRNDVVQFATDRECIGACPLGSIGAEVARIDHENREEVANSINLVRKSFENGFQKMLDNGQLDSSTDINALAATMIAVFQGGLLLSQINRNVKPLATALDTMIDLIENIHHKNL